MQTGSQQPAAAAGAAADASPLPPHSHAEQRSAALSWPAALRAVGLLQAGPALAGFAIRAAFRHTPCGSGAAAAAATGAAAGGGSAASWLSHKSETAADAGVVAATAAACVLAAVAWRHYRMAAASEPRGSGGSLAAAGGADGGSDGAGGGGGASESTSAATRAAAGTGSARWRAVLVGHGWRRLKAALLAAVIVQLSVMACIDWAAAAAALFLLTPWLCLARPLPRHNAPKEASVGDRGSFLLLVLLSPWTVVGLLGGLAVARDGALLGGILHDVAGSNTAGAAVSEPGLTVMGGTILVLRLLAASPVLSALLFGVYAPAWACCALIASSPA